MKRLTDEQIAKLAFGELDQIEESRVRQDMSDDNEQIEKLAEYDAMRTTLKNLANDVPACQMSVERVRDAILAQNLKEKRSGIGTWSWVWAPIATGVLVFAFMSQQNRHSNLNNVALNSPALSRPDKDGFMKDIPGPLLGPSNPDNWLPDPGAGKKDVIVDVRPKGDVAKGEADNGGNVHKVIPVINSPSPRGGSSRGTPGVDRSGKNGAHSPKNKPSKPLILVQADTDDTTGAQSATEVESVANVSIGG